MTEPIPEWFIRNGFIGIILAGEMDFAVPIIHSHSSLAGVAAITRKTERN